MTGARMWSADLVQRKAGIGVDGVEIGSDGGFQVRRRAVDVAAYLLFGDVDEEPLDLIDQEPAVGVK